VACVVEQKSPRGTCSRRQYTFTALFATVVLLFNPVVPTFALAGNLVISLAGVLPFVASLVWMKERTRRAAVPTSALG
jgi:hypothetical protein